MSLARGEGEMGRSKHTEAQVISCAEAGSTVDDVARDCGVSQATIYAWKAKYGGLEVSKARWLRLLEDELTFATPGSESQPGQGDADAS
jgi:putative transposase